MNMKALTQRPLHTLAMLLWFQSVIVAWAVTTPSWGPSGSGFQSIVWPEDLQKECDESVAIVNNSTDTVQICVKPDIAFAAGSNGVYTIAIPTDEFPHNGLIVDLDVFADITIPKANKLKLTLLSPLKKHNVLLPNSSCVGQPPGSPSNIKVTLNEQAYNIALYQATGIMIPALFTCTSALPVIGSFNQGHMKTKDDYLDHFNGFKQKRYGQKPPAFTATAADFSFFNSRISNAEIAQFILEMNLIPYDRILLRYEVESGDALGGLIPGNLYSFTVYDANTIELNTIGGGNITQVPVNGTHRFSATDEWLVVVEDFDTLNIGNINEVCLYISYIKSHANIDVVVLDRFGEGVNDVAIQTIGSQNVPTVLTDAQGMAGLGSWIVDEDYTIIPEKNMNPLNGVDIEDAVAIAQHVLGIKTISNPYQLIAADINQSCDLTMTDVTHLMQVITEPWNGFDKNTSWRFVTSDYTLPPNKFPCGFPASVYYSGIPADPAVARFVGVKIGDVTGDADPSQLVKSDIRTVADPLVFQTKNIWMDAGMEYTVVLRAYSRERIMGFQYTMDFGDAVILEIVPIMDGLSKNNFGQHPEYPGILTVGWYHPIGVATEQGAPLYGIRIRPSRSGFLNESLSITSDHTRALAVYDDGSRGSVALQFHSDRHGVEGAILFPNVPNPFVYQTRLSFYLPTEQWAHLAITDASGRLIHEVTGVFPAGVNAMDWQPAFDTHDQLFYCTLTTESGTSTMLMSMSR